MPQGRISWCRLQMQWPEMDRKCGAESGLHGFSSSRTRRTTVLVLCFLSGVLLHTFLFPYHAKHFFKSQTSEPFAQKSLSLKKAGYQTLHRHGRDQNAGWIFQQDGYKIHQTTKPPNSPD